MQRRHVHYFGQSPSVGHVRGVIKEFNISDDAVLSGWGDGSVAIHWYVEETPAERQERINREAQAAYNQERRGM